MNAIPLPVRRLPHGHGLPLPQQHTDEAACIDLYAAIPEGPSGDIVLQPGQRATVPTGLAYAIPAGHCGQVWPRSGLAVKHGIDTLAGMVDSDYRGELMVALINHGDAAFTIRRGDRVAQFLIAPYAHVKLVETADLPETNRGTGGFGSTGT